jgi:N-acetylglucosaminyl-diphospho-decaprenol L-rhamnosyltransferase
MNAADAAAGAAREGATLGVVIVNYNTSRQTVACLDSVASATALTTRVIVVDNGSVDDSVSAIRSTHGEVTIVEAGENLGFATAVNAGARLLATPYLVLLNPDTVVLPGALDALVEFAQVNPQYSVYGGRTLRPDGSTDPSSCWAQASLWSLTSFAIGTSTLFRRSALFDPESLGGWERDTVREVPIVTGCLLLARRADWERLGGMDERFFLYGEDAEFALRAQRLGMRAVIVPEATIIHDVGGSTESNGLKMCMVMAGKATLFRMAWPRARARAAIALLQAGALVRSALEVVARRRRTWTTVWQRRRDWRSGYPLARERLFGIGESQSQQLEGTT